MAQIQLLKHAKNLMIIGGVWRQPIIKNSKIEKLYYVYAYTLQIFYITGVISMVTEFFYLLGSKDVEKLADNMKLTISCLLAAIKLIIFQNGYIPKLITQMIDEEQSILYSEDQETKSIYFRFVQYINKSSIAILILTNVTVLFRAIAITVLGLVTKSYVNYNGSKPMLISAHFPFDQDQHYGMSLIIQGFFVALGSLYYCMSQILYITIVIFPTAQIKILQNYFRKSDYYVLAGRPALKDIDLAKMLIKRHQFIISFVQELNESLKYLLLIEFLLSSLNIASVAFQLISPQTIAEMSFTFCHFCVLIGQLFILGWHANEIKLESIAVSDAVYESPWYEKTIEVRKMLLLIMLRSHTPLVLTIGPFIPLTTETVVSVINGAYSFVTIMTNHN